MKVVHSGTIGGMPMGEAVVRRPRRRRRDAEERRLQTLGSQGSRASYYRVVGTGTAPTVSSTNTRCVVRRLLVDRNSGHDGTYTRGLLGRSGRVRWDGGWT